MPARRCARTSHWHRPTAARRALIKQQERADEYKEFIARKIAELETKQSEQQQQLADKEMQA